VAELKAIEPSEGMRNTFLKNIRDDRVSVSEGGFDNTHIEDGWADLVVIAQVRFFHNTASDERNECINDYRLSTGAQITIVLPQSSLASSNRKAPSLSFGIWRIGTSSLLHATHFI
jgi:hypothetical protein